MYILISILLDDCFFIVIIILFILFKTRLLPIFVIIKFLMQINWERKKYLLVVIQLYINLHPDWNLLFQSFSVYRFLDYSASILPNERRPRFRRRQTTATSVSPLVPSEYPAFKPRDLSRKRISNRAGFSKISP